MTVFSSLPADAHLMHIFKRFPKMVMPLLELHDAILRSDSGLSIGERELIAAYASLQNACTFCHGAHTSIASMYGIDEATLEQLNVDLESADIPEKLKPILAYVKKLTLTPAKIMQADADAVYAAGWSEEDLFDAISTCALFNFMNRIVDGSDISVSAPISQQAAQGITMESYVGIAKRLEDS
ncbi:MAG: peroxidase [SAR86 cluster bacterium]|uniref:Peroxidase n=1 Tax=SAR86 cluster bacterium TaxID=2030880 RepID=A0A2A5C8Q2_9GAMM|nr:peroxidase-related enzyme [Gammaproteobacteria bacterium AH-315-E17]PCJ40133.1 MAG: peroxidase [SAR86 cluster bacterium]